MGVVYRHTVEAFLDQVARRRNLFTTEELVHFGVSPARDTPIEAWDRFLRATAARLGPGKGEAEALELTGREMVRGYLQGLVGRSVMMVAKLLGPRRMLQRLPENYRTADNVMDCTATVRGDREVLIQFNTVYGLPTYVRGVIAETMDTMGVKHRIVVSDTPGGGTSYLVTWD